MRFHDKFIRSQLELIKPIADAASLEFSRAAQDKIGRLMQFTRRKSVIGKGERYPDIPGELVLPREELMTGIILYLHGGGYTCGSLDYARGVASMLSGECGMRVFCPEYRLAPENPYPAALLDAYSAYRALLSKGYTPSDIILAGESAGGGLAFSLSLKLKSLGEPMPAGIIAISPWCDLTLSGASMTENAERDPSLTKKRLEFFADCYVGERDCDAEGTAKKRERDVKNLAKKLDPYVSPLFADLSGMPRTVIFAGSDEILLSDAVRMHERLVSAGVSSELHVRENMWHAYILYNLKSSREDISLINDFIKRTLGRERQKKLRWMHLDNAAKIYPAAASSHWTNLFRLSATMKEDVDRAVLQSALDVTVRRFPSIAVRLRRGTFWYYLEEIKHAPEICDEKPYPLVRMPFDDIRSCAFRVIVYKKRIAVEFFHALTDGNGGLVFLKTLLAEYITQKYGVTVPCEFGVLDRLEAPREEELCDNFPKYSAPVGFSRNEENSYRIQGTPEEYGFSHNVTFLLSADELTELAHKIGVSVTALLAAAFISAAIRLQKLDVPNIRRRKPVKILIPVDLRRIFGVDTMRNFALYVTPGVDSRLGEYEFAELCHIVADKMHLDITEKNMRARIYPNVRDEKRLILKLTPLFLKNIVMKAVFRAVGEKKSALTLSNLGRVRIPEVMKEHISRFDFVLGVQESAPYNAGLISYGDKAYLNIIRNIREPRLEYELYKVLREVGIKVKVESNSSR